MQFPLVRRYFLTGLVVLVPVFITISVLSAIVGFFSNTPIGQIFDQEANRLLFNRRDPDTFYRGFGLLATLMVVLATGVVASTLLGHRIVDAIELLLMKTPIVNVIYPPAKQMMDFVLAPKAQGFSQVVLVEFPRPGTYSLGFVTGEAPESLRLSLTSDIRYVSVFVPFAPAPMSGALMVVREEEVLPVSMTVEEAFKFIISAGVLTTTKAEEPGEGILRGA